MNLAYDFINRMVDEQVQRIQATVPVNKQLAALHDIEGDELHDGLVEAEAYSLARESVMGEIRRMANDRENAIERLIDMVADGRTLRADAEAAVEAQYTRENRRD